jgi:AraC-like DNA-binding protein
MLLEVKLNLHPVNFLIISGILQSIILAGVLMFYRKGNRQANKLIGLFVLICSLHFSWSLIIDSNIDYFFPAVFWIPYSYLLAIGPLLFFYTKSLTKPGVNVNYKDLIHLLPVATEILSQIYFINQSIRHSIVPYEVQGFLVFRIIEFLGTGTSILIYGKQCLSLIRVHEAWVIDNFSNKKDVTLAWLFRLIKYLRILWIFWLVFELSFILFWQFQLHLIPVYLLLYLLIGVITYSNYWIAIQALHKSEVLAEKTVALPVPNASVYARLPETEFNRYREALDQLMQRERLYLHENLTLRTLANKLEMDPNLVSYVLNNILRKSFYDYVNEFRIEAVKQKIGDPAYAHLKIVEIAYECGFNSKATFNRVFKKLAGKAPSEYRTVDQ